MLPTPGINVTELLVHPHLRGHDSSLFSSSSGLERALPLYDSTSRGTKIIAMADEITPVLEFPGWHDDPVGGDPFTQDLAASYDKACLANEIPGDLSR